MIQTTKNFVRAIANAAGIPLAESAVGAPAGALVLAEDDSESSSFGPRLNTALAIGGPAGNPIPTIQRAQRMRAFHPLIFLVFAAEGAAASEEFSRLNATLKEMPLAYGSDVLADRCFEASKATGSTSARVILVRGHFPSPTIRVDDYPTGIRPIVEDLAPVNKVLEVFESNAVPYHLAISPGLLDKEMAAFLRSCRAMVPCLHGHDHHYWPLSSKLRHSGDMFNKGVDTKIGRLMWRIKLRMGGSIREFAGLHPDTVREKIHIAKDQLEMIVGQEIKYFIPPFDRTADSVGPAIEALGFEAYLSQVQIRGTRLPGIRADMARTSQELDFNLDYGSICLHTLWEWDLVRTGIGHRLEELCQYSLKKQAESAEMERKLVSTIDQMALLHT